MKQNTVIIAMVTAILAAGLGFYGGMKYQQSKRVPFSNIQENRQFTGARDGNIVAQNGRGTFRPVSGEIIKKDGTSVTVKLSEGSTKIVLLSNDTKILKTEEGTASDLTIGAMVAVFGTENADGSITSQNIQINPTSVR